MHNNETNSRVYTYSITRVTCRTHAIYTYNELDLKLSGKYLAEQRSREWGQSAPESSSRQQHAVSGWPSLHRIVAEYYSQVSHAVIGGECRESTLENRCHPERCTYIRYSQQLLIAD